MTTDRTLRAKLASGRSVSITAYLIRSSTVTNLRIIWNDRHVRDGFVHSVRTINTPPPHTEEQHHRACRHQFPPVLLENSAVDALRA